MKKIGRKVDIKKFARRLVIIAIVFVAFFYASSNIVKGTSLQREFVYYITYYFGSTIALMGRIVVEPSLCHEPFVGYFGEKTFWGFWSDLYSKGIVNNEPAERLWINMGSSLHAYSAGNEYTFLCGPYIDFGFLGCLIFVILFYFVFAQIYYHKIRRTRMSINRCIVCAIYLFLYTMVAMSFYQDTIRSYSRLINILYIIYIIVFCKTFLRLKIRKE